MTATQVNLTERGENVVISKKKRSSPRIRLRFLDFHHQNLVFSKKKTKKVFTSNLIPIFFIFFLSSQRQLKKVLHFSNLLRTDLFRLRAIIYKPSGPTGIALPTHFWVAIHGLRNTVLASQRLITLSHCNGSWVSIWFREFSRWISSKLQNQLMGHCW